MSIEDDVPGRYRALCDRALSGRSRKAAVRAYCLWCCCWSPAEVKLCVCPGCPLFASANRLRDPHRSQGIPADRRYEPPAHYRPLYEKALAGGDRAAAIRANCLMCTGWSRADTKACEATDCSLWPYRLTGRATRRRRNGPARPEPAILEALATPIRPGQGFRVGSTVLEAQNAREAVSWGVEHGAGAT